MDDELKKYEDRAIRWQETALSQMGYTNNIILTLTLAFLAFAFNDNTIPSTSFTPNTALNNNLCLHFSSVVCLMLSVLFGVASSLFRLYDFRITRNITLTRKRYYEETLDGETDSKTLPDYSFPYPKCKLQFKTAFHIICRRIKLIEKNTLKEKNGKKQFNYLRRQSFVLGILSWKCLKLQFILLSVAVITYTINLIILH